MTGDLRPALAYSDGMLKEGVWDFPATDLDDAVLAEDVVPPPPVEGVAYDDAYDDAYS